MQQEDFDYLHTKNCHVYDNLDLSLKDKILLSFFILLLFPFFLIMRIAKIFFSR